MDNTKWLWRKVLGSWFIWSRPLALFSKRSRLKMRKPKGFFNGLNEWLKFQVTEIERQFSFWVANVWKCRTCAHLEIRNHSGHNFYRQRWPCERSVEWWWQQQWFWAWGWWCCGCVLMNQWKSRFQFEFAGTEGTLKPQIVRSSSLLTAQLVLCNFDFFPK